MSEVKVNKISPRTNCGTVQLGDSGDTFTIPAGASITNSGTASGFGATGSASWNTTVKTGDFTAVVGEGYFVNTTSGAVNVTLPAGTAGAVVAIKDYAGTFDTNAVTLTRNGSDKIGGQAVNATLGTEGIAVTLVFIDSTQGWLVTDSGLQDEAPTAAFTVATGGTITTSGNFKIHTFTAPGTFTVCSVGNACGSNTVSYMVVAGGGGGGGSEAVADPTAVTGGGGGAGGYRESKAATDSYTASPLNATSGPTYNLPVSAQGYPITVGAGGSAGTNSPREGANGSASIFSSITSAGGGGTPGITGGSGGSGGGVRGACSVGNVGAGNTPPVSPPQGNPGGVLTVTSSPYGAAGGGGAFDAGRSNGPSGAAGVGGSGVTSSINATPTARAGGGGGANGHPSTNAAAGGTGGGGGGARPLINGTTNTGGGGAGAVADSPGLAGTGGSGIVIIRYKFQ